MADSSLIRPDHLIFEGNVAIEYDFSKGRGRRKKEYLTHEPAECVVDAESRDDPERLKRKFAEICIYIQVKHRTNTRLRAVEDKLGVKIKLEECPKSGTSGIYTIYGIAYPEGLSVYCDTQTDGGGWVVIQRRFNEKLNFDREWDQYVKGFGTLSGEFWLGKIKFLMGGTSSNYQLTASGYSGTTGDSLSHHSGMAFSTKDMDNDTDDDGNCDKDLKGGWCFTGCNLSHLNGVYYKGGHYPVGLHTVQDGASWYYWKDTKLYSMKTTEMKIRLKN
uniref:fibrinogen C domain-containing protein 1-like n=1 Tax=Styela clava TaxID=7725 RepID=UPI00193A2FA9|nr:fibrinogen C domain-containing protein 1-like [Styela clava]